VGNIKSRLKRLERGRKQRGFSVLIVHPGEDVEEVKQRHLAEHPESASTEVRIILDLSAQGSPGVSPPSRPEPQYKDNAPPSGSRPLQITR
jgi:hypothetical protein